MLLRFLKNWDYAHDGIRIVRYQEGQIVDTDSEKAPVDATFAQDCIERDHVAVIHDGKAPVEADEEEIVEDETKARKDKVENKSGKK